MKIEEYFLLYQIAAEQQELFTTGNLLVAGYAQFSCRRAIVSF